MIMMIPLTSEHMLAATCYHKIIREIMIPRYGPALFSGLTDSVLTVVDSILTDKPVSSSNVACHKSCRIPQSLV